MSTAEDYAKRGDAVGSYLAALREQREQREQSAQAAQVVTPFVPATESELRSRFNIPEPPKYQPTAEEQRIAGVLKAQAESYKPYQPSEDDKAAQRDLENRVRARFAGRRRW